jgi:hypothetical protein
MLKASQGSPRWLATAAAACSKRFRILRGRVWEVPCILWFAADLLADVCGLRLERCLAIQRMLTVPRWVLGGIGPRLAILALEGEKTSWLWSRNGFDRVNFWFGVSSHRFTFLNLLTTK